MIDKKYLFMNCSFSIFTFLLYFIFHLISNSPFILNPLIIPCILFVLDVTGAILKTKINIESMAKFIFIYDCIAYGLTLYLIIYDFAMGAHTLSFIICLILGILFSSVFYPLNKKLYNSL